MGQLAISVCSCHLHALLHEVLAHPRLHAGRLHARDDGLEGAVDCGDPPATLHGDIEVVGESSSRHFKDIVWSFLVKEDLTEGRDEGARGAAGKAEGRQEGRQGRRERERRGRGREKGEGRQEGEGRWREREGRRERERNNRMKDILFDVCRWKVPFYM